MSQEDRTKLEEFRYISNWKADELQRVTEKKII